MKDELNVFKEYFSVMEISDKQKKRRVDLAMEFYDAFLVFFSLSEEARLRGKDYKPVLDSLADSIALIVKPNDEYLKKYVEKISEEVFTTTFSFGAAYYLSNKRAIILAQNEANSVENYRDYKSALGQYKTKTWLSEIDDKTRFNHLLMDETTIPIDEYFVFPDCEMLFPHDEINGTPQEVINCRCSVIYE